MSYAIPNTLGRVFNISSIFLWNMSPAGATLNGNLENLYVLNWHEKVVMYDDFVSNSRLWYHELASIRVI